MPQNRWKYPDGSVTIKLYEPFPAGESLLLKLEDKTMDYNKAALEMHETHKGKVGIVSKVEVATRDDLSTAYTPGVAEPCRKIKENPDDVYKYTFKGNMVAVVSNGTAVLGLGDIGPEAGLPVMEGKAVLFKEFGGVDAFPICIDAHDAASVIAACKAIAPTFGGINLEDIKSPECFEIEETLERELDIPVQLGGGIRDEQTARAYLEAGVQRLIIGTMALEQPEAFASLCKTFPGQIGVSLDAEGGRLKTKGWVADAGLSVDDVLPRLQEDGAAFIIYTDIERDGMQCGVNLTALRHLAETSTVPVIAAGGVATLADVQALYPLSTQANLQGAISGRALYEGTLDLVEANAWIAAQQ